MEETDSFDQHIQKLDKEGEMPDDWCIDCDINTVTAGEYYMVNDHVWSQTGIDTYGGMLCILCLEKRIGRNLISEDFLDIPINHIPLFRSNLLLERMSF